MAPGQHLGPRDQTLAPAGKMSFLKVLCSSQEWLWKGQAQSPMRGSVPDMCWGDVGRRKGHLPHPAL